MIIIDEDYHTPSLCRDGDKLINCDNCPTTCHLTYLFTQDLHERSWYCSLCTSKKCGDVVKCSEALSSPGGLKCSRFSSFHC